MATTLQDLQEYRDTLLKDLAMPRRVQFGERALLNHDPEQIRAAIAEVDRQIAELSGQTTERKFTIQTSRGL
jgi:hypothetical protein